MQLSPSSALFLLFAIISMCKDVECGGGRGAIIGEEDTVEEPAEQSIAIDDVPSLVELIDDSLNDYEYKTGVPDSVIVPIHLYSSPSKRGGGRRLKRGGGRPVDILNDVMEKRGGATLFPNEKRGGGRIFKGEKRGGGGLFKRGGGRPSVIEPEDDYSM
ncbi:hypothetical protein PRIPAC_94902 [Pristionchus pacificus]|uniref:Uncharacterized protein n=1 Tax=Pristionchus pacificus TaxID=54126 RepID=A0A2A6CR68_PRIPA|nr:hypothetical protein PRIPAC_94902 [Pristionchus pacificus]|eukprot:PDM80521.1 hypothetical protein PRIPAC_35513 [Pristionchus pacificus]